MRNALVILDHECPPGRNPARHCCLREVAQEFLFSEPDEEEADEPEFSAVIVVDLSALLVPRDGDVPGTDVVGDEAVMAQFGKRMEKPVVRFLERLYLIDATVVARGACCQFAVKLLSPTASRALTPKNITKIVMLHPALTPAFINEQLGDKAAAALKGVELHAVFQNEREQRRRNPILRSCCPAGRSLTREQVTREHAAILLPVLLGPAEEDVEPAQEEEEEEAEGPAYDPERCDQLGRSLFFAEVRIEMDPVSKYDKQVFIDTTAEMQGPEVILDDDADGEAGIDVANFAREVGALVLRGNRCVLCMSPHGLWEGVRVPSLEPALDETPLECAVRSVTELCEIDGESEIVPLPNIMPVNIYMPGGRPVVVTLYPLYAVNPPPPGADDSEVADTDTGDEDEEEDWFYDWHTFPKAIAALQRQGDDATVAALQSLAFALKGAASARAVPVKWGGIFGQELTGSTPELDQA